MMKARSLRHLSLMCLMICYCFQGFAQSPDFLESFEGSGSAISGTWRHSGNGRAHRSTDFAHEGSKAIKFEVRASESVNYRDEIVFNGGPFREMTFGSEWWYGFSVYVPHNWKPDATGDIFFQVHRVQDAHDSRSVGANPPLSIRFKEDKIEFNHRWHKQDPWLVREHSYNETVNVLKDVVPGRWYDFVFHMIWSKTAGSGITEVWMNGQKKYSHIGPNTYVDQVGPYVKFGIYKSLWKKSTHTSASAARGITERIYYQDNIRLYKGANGYSVVAPNSSSTPIPPDPPTPPANLEDELRINAGGNSILSAQGEIFDTDGFYGINTSTSSTTDSIGGTTDQQLYQTHRSAQLLQYDLPIKNGIYDLTLHFANLNPKVIGQAVFDIDIEHGADGLTAYDIGAQVPELVATQLQFTGIQISDEALTVLLTATAGVAKISGIELVKTASTTPPSNGIRINAGGGDHAAANGELFETDKHFSSTSSAISSNHSISGTSDPTLYQTHRSGQAFGYTIPIENGSYEVRLHFANLNPKSVGDAVFDIDIEQGTAIQQAYDIAAYVPDLVATQLTFPGITVSDGYMTIDFLASAGFAKVSAIEIIADSAAVIPPASSMSLTSTEATFSSSGNADKNYGDKSFIKLWDGNTVYESFLKFDLSTIQGSIQSATLKLYAVTPANKDIRVGETGDNWDEQSLTHNNRPSQIGGDLGTLATGSSSGYYGIEVTSLVQTEASGDGIVSFLLKGPLPSGILEMDSDEGTHPPILEINASSPSNARKESPGIQSEPGSMTVFPNPNQGQCYLRCEQEMHAEIYVLDITGRVLHTELWEGSPGELKKLNLSHVPKGIYLLKVPTAKQHMIQKLILE